MSALPQLEEAGCEDSAPVHENIFFPEVRTGLSDPSRNTPITKRGEKVDFMGIFLSGSALIQLGDKKFGYMKMGDFVGYMAFLEIPG